MKWFLKGFCNYVNFKGRARRKEYWCFVLFYCIFMALAMIADKLIFGKSSVLYLCVALVVFLPSLAVWARRLHDTGRSAKWILWYYLAGIVWVVLLAITGASYLMNAMKGVPMEMPSASFLAIYCIGGLGIFVFAIFLLVWLCQRGTSGDNKYGPDPLAVEE